MPISSSQFDFRCYRRRLMADSPYRDAEGEFVMRIPRSTAASRITASLLAGASLLAVAPAAAQDAEAEASQPTQNQSGQNVIIVTALKREQNLQDVPMAITALGN